MAKVYLDANIIVDIIEERKTVTIKDFEIHDLYASPLSIHILTYLYKYKMPNKKLAGFIDEFIFIPFDDVILYKAVLGPTTDFEDNAQLHSAAEADCDIFLTNDEKLLKMKFFGKTRINSNL